MGLYDREYTQESFNNQYGGMPRMRMTFPSLTPMVKRLLIINIAVFLLGIIIKPLGGFLYQWGSIDASSWFTRLQLWRLVTYQFLHDQQMITHIIFNMIGLYFLGPTLERNWGSKRFIIFYLGCGIAGGLFYLFLVSVHILDSGLMVGASGAILGMLAACAILFPQFVVFFLFFPVPIRVAALIMTVLYIFNIIVGGPNAGGDAAHLAGMAAGAVYVFWPYLKNRIVFKPRAGRWEKKMYELRNLQAEVDRILEKVHDKGIHSLTFSEKRTLKRATKIQRELDRF
ncbi:MAG: rhomboid family intramembrane serine protease [Candidatus Brocadiia bacterium]|nr:MAG: rhomboid family intramembrane serine protease [Candidatus Brocadiia bacterium]